MPATHTLLIPQSTLPSQGEIAAATWDSITQQHLKALRIKHGELISFMDGQGHLVHTRCTETRPLLFEILESHKSPAPFPFIELCLGSPKGEALWEGLHQATEMGVSRIRLLKTDHSQIPKGLDLPRVRAQKICDAACSQCQRAWRVDIVPEWGKLESALEEGQEYLQVFADESLSKQGIFGFEKTQKLALKANQKIQLFIGPEGGWSEQERELLNQKAQPLGLGPLVLRVPTAVVAALFFLRSHFWSKPSGS